jgi:hypothetical protein
VLPAVFPPHWIPPLTHQSIEDVWLIKKKHEKGLYLICCTWKCAQTGFLRLF